MRIRRASTHLDCDPDGLHDLLSGRAAFQGGRRVAAYAIRALGDMGDGHGISCFVSAGRAPSAKTLSLNALNAASGPGASCLRLAAIPGSDGGNIALSIAWLPMLVQ